ncbi:MAG: mechanosensitive ion channel family protein [Treponema sp.]|jgi:small-conductance mechanosensitive channel|nr:mechanosensitive ion channel family protein [Treponema sp.]
MKKTVFVIIISLLLFSPFAAAQEDGQNGGAVELLQIPVEETNEETGINADELQEPPVDEPVQDAIDNNTDTMAFITRLGIALGIIAGQALLIWLVWLFFKFLSQKTVQSGSGKIKPLTIKKLKLLSTKQIINSILFFLKIIKYLITALQLFLTLPIVFSFFPATNHLAKTLFGYILDPLKNIVLETIRYIPNLITIIIIVVITRYVLKGLKFFTTHIAKGRLVIPGFYPDWADPTYKILQVLLWAFTVALAYPYLPGSDSRVFQGVSVFVGIIFSLGSSSAIGNLVAGLVITYMRPFKIGDRVQIKESIGFVVEKNLMVVRLKTHKNEYVTFPNLTILNSSIINYNTSSDEDEEGLILNTEITFGYATPWQTIHEILINAALETEHVLKRPKPFVLQTGLNDFYARYQINCYAKEVSMVPKIYTQLYENIQNGFREAGLDMTAPHYEVLIESPRDKGAKTSKN